MGRIASNRRKASKHHTPTYLLKINLDNQGYVLDMLFVILKKNVTV